MIVPAPVLPTTRDENWKHAPLRGIERLRWAPPTVLTPESRLAATALLGDDPPQGAISTRIVLIDGLHCPELARGPVGSDAAGAGSGVAFHATDALAQPGAATVSIDLAFAGLNRHHRQGELRIRVPDGETLDLEVVCIALSCGHPALRIDLGARASLRLFERHIGATGSLANLALSVQLGHGARLEHARLLQPADGARHFETLEAVVGADAHHRMIQVTSGAAATRSTALVALEGAGADLGWHTAVLGAGTQTHDAYVRVTHDAPAVRTEQGFRGIAADRSRIAFNGHMRVTARAPGAHSAQTLRGLTAGAAAEIDLRPQLEIDIDDVRASHGATIGKLDADMLFYLLSRGLDPATADSLLKWAFIADVIARLSDPAWRSRFEDALAPLLPGAHAARSLT
jgi:Fe-S cluster assembly protein SufD